MVHLLDTLVSPFALGPFIPGALFCCDASEPRWVPIVISIQNLAYGLPGISPARTGYPWATRRRSITLRLVSMGSHAIVSQQAYICGATHDYNDPSFPLISFPMSLGAYSWVCARASVSPGVNLGEGAVLGLGSVATRDLEPWTVYAGVPAQPIKQRAGREPRTPAT